MINFINCKNIFLEGIIFQNSPIWNIHLLICEDVIIDNIYSKNPSYAQNGDGIDIESCNNILIINYKYEALKMMEFVLKVVKMKMEEKEIKY